MFGKILIANRGEIAVRVMRTARRMGIATAAIYSDADRQSLHVKMADEAWRVGPAPASESYLNAEAVVAAAKRSGAEAIHPGYGFLSENPDFAEAVGRAGLVFIGPPAAAIRAMGLKDRARQLMQQAGVPVLPGYGGGNQVTAHLASEAERIGYPILIKPVAGGGGKGMHRVEDPRHFTDALASARREAASSFGDDRMLIEKYLPKARHIEIQIFADRHGNTIHLFERDCSLQRRHQKVIEEAPAPGMTEALRARMGEAAVEAAKAVGYVGAGTVEFIADVSAGLHAGRFYFMEMNTRLQVEHPVTEMITGLDLVEWQLRVAAGEALPLQQHEITISGHAIEARLYAEDPTRNFLPQTGRLSWREIPDGARIDTGLGQGDTITSHYDPMIAKLIVRGSTRADALRKLTLALGQTRIGGLRTNLAFLSRLARHTVFAAGEADTGFVERNIGQLAQGAAPPMEAVAAALLHATGYLREPESHSPFDTLINFRLWPGEMLSAEFAVDGIAVQASLAVSGSREFELRQAGVTLPFSLLDHDGASLRIATDGRIVPLTVFDDGGVLAIELSGEHYEFDYRAPAAAHGGEELGDGKVTAPVPGLVSLVSVVPGDHVAMGDTIAVIEAMKMEFTLRAARGGRIATLQVAAGDQVEEGTVVAVIEDGDA